MAVQHKDRILFLKEFTKHLIINSVPEGEIRPPVQQMPAPRMIPAPQKVMPVAPAFRMQPKIPQEFKPSLQPQIKPKTEEIRPSPTALPEEFSLGKLEALTKDPRITMIECPGPDKLVLVRVAGRVNTTKISLSQKEIQQIVGEFSKASKIPIISGLFKAAVGNLTMTAVISEFVGSRFIITKITPRFVLEQRPMGLPSRSQEQPSSPKLSLP